MHRTIRNVNKTISVLAIIAIIVAFGAVAMLTSISLTTKPAAAFLFFNHGTCNKIFHLFEKGKTPCSSF